MTQPPRPARRRNPLRDPRDRRLPRVPEPCALVVFGVTGDLARKKLIPAVYDLANRGLLPPGFVLLGFARRDWGDGDFESTGPQGGRRSTPGPPWRDEVWARLAGQHQVRARARSTTTTRSTRWPTTLDELRDTHGIQGNAAFYLSIPPAAFPVVLKQMQRTGMADNEQSGGWRRVVVEKPFGHDLRVGARAQRPGRRRVHRRRTCSGSTTTWARRRSRTSWRCGSPTRCSSRCGTRNYVDSVQITMAEDVGIGSRAGFYDTAGAARDVLQNHLLQLLALIAMEEPVELRRRGDPDREAQGAAGDHAARRPRSGYASAASTTQGWLAGERVVGYLDEKDVPPDSHHRDLRGGPARRRDPPLGRRAVLPPHRQAAAAPGHRDRGPVQEGAAPAVRRRPTPRCSATTSSSSGSSPTRASRSSSAPRCRASAMEVRDIAMDFLYGEAFTESSPGGVRAADPRRAARRRDAVPAQRRGRGRPGGWSTRWRQFWAGKQAGARTGPASGARGRPTRCWPATAAPGGGRDARRAEARMIDAVGHHRHRGRQGARRRAAQRRRRGHRPGADPGRRRRREATSREAEAAATTAAAAHPCRLLIVVRRQIGAPTTRLDAEMSVGGRLGPARPS